MRLVPQGLRDWVHSAQVAQALAGMLLADTLAHRTYNLSPGQVWHPSVFCQALQALDPAFDWSVVDAVEQSNINLFDDLSRQRSALQVGRALGEAWGCRADVAASAEHYAQWVVSNKSWFS